MGYADGAMVSGIREAKRLLGAEAVRLGRVEPPPTTGLLREPPLPAPID